MPGKAAKVTVTERQHAILSRVADLNPRSSGVMPSPGSNLLRPDRPTHRRVSLRASVSSDRRAQDATLVGERLARAKTGA
jgi:hypothetical protein